MSTGNRKRRKKAGLLPSGLKCTAHKKDGSPCQRPPMTGGNVCYHHGGAAPQTVAAARRRLMGASNNVALLLLKIAEDEKTPPPVRLAAIRDVLDRAGVTVRQEVEVTVQPWQQIIDGIVAEVPDAALRGRSALERATHQPGDWIPGEVVEDLEGVPLIDGLPVPQAPAPTAQVKIPSRRKQRKTKLGR